MGKTQNLDWQFDRRHLNKMRMSLVLLSMLTFYLSPICAAELNFQWESVGPGGGGAMYTPTLSPIDPDMGMITCDMSAVYLTRDGGQNWTMLPASAVGRYGHGVAFSPGNKNVIYVGTSSKLHVSVDGGASWTGVTADRKYPLCSVMHVLVDPDKPERVWACFGKGAEAGHQVSQANRLLIERSTNGGKSFSDASSGLPTGSGLVRQLAIDVNSPVNKRILYAATTEGLFVSQDGGASWQKTGTGIKNNNIRQVVTMCDRETKKTIVIASSDPAGVYRSEDGRSFSPVQGMPAATVVEGLAGSTENGTTAWAAGEGLWKTRDGGKTWTSVLDNATKAAGWLHTFYAWQQDKFRGVGCDPTNPDRVWATGDMVLWSSMDGGATFTELNSHPFPENTRRILFKDGSELGRFGLAAKKESPKRFAGNGLEVTFNYQVCPDPQDKNTVYSCYADIGGFRSGDHGASWTYNLGLWNNGLPSNWRNSCYDIAFHPNKKGLIWGAFSGLHNLPQELSGGQYEIGGVAVSTDGGETWNPFENAGLPNKPITSVCFDRRSSGKSLVLYATVFGGGVYRSTDGGNKWSAMNDGLPNNAYAWRVRQSADEAVYLICTHARPGGLWRYAEESNRWQRLDTNFENVRDMVVDKGGDWNPKVLAIAVDDKDKGGVYVSRDSGNSWKRIFDQPARSVDCTPDEKIWFACGNGLWRSVGVGVGGGGAWTALAFPFSSLNDVTISPADPETLWVGTAGGGIFKAAVDGSALDTSKNSRSDKAEQKRNKDRKKDSADKQDEAKPAIADEIQSKWHQRLVERLQARIDRKASMNFQSYLMKGKDAMVKEVTQDKLTVSTTSITLPISWSRVPDADRVALTKMLARESEDSLDHAVAAWYHSLYGDRFEASEYLVKAGDLKDEIKADLGQ